MANDLEALFVAEFGRFPSPFWWDAATVFIILFAAVTIGDYFGRSTFAKRALSGAEDDGGGGSILPASLTLLSLLIGFTIGFLLSWEDKRKSAVTEEVLAIGTAYNHADLLEESARSDLQTALFNYAKTRQRPDIDTLSEDALRMQIENALKARNDLWPITRDAIGPVVAPAIRTDIADKVNDAMDSSERRRKTMTESIDRIAKFALLGMAFTTLALVGYREASKGEGSSWIRVTVVGLFGLVLVLSLDIERPHSGLIRIDGSSLSELVSGLQADLEGRSN